MKNKLQTAALLAVLALPFGCATLLPEPTAQDVPSATRLWPGVKLADLQMGKSLYVAHCAECHSLHAPGELTDEKWPKVMEKMGHKAKIDEKTQDTILAYLEAFDRDAPKPAH